MVGTDGCTPIGPAFRVAIRVWVLCSVFRKGEAEAVAVMLDVHRKGKGVAGVYPYDIADTKAAQVKAMAEAKEFPLLCTLEPES